MALHLDPQICRNVAAAMGREWLVTNGLGGCVVEPACPADGAAGGARGVAHRARRRAATALGPGVLGRDRLPGWVPLAGGRRCRRHAAHLSLGGSRPHHRKTDMDGTWRLADGADLSAAGGPTAFVTAPATLCAPRLPRAATRPRRL